MDGRRKEEKKPRRTERKKEFRGEGGKKKKKSSAGFKQAPGCSQSPAWLSPKNPVADPAPGLGFQPPWSPCRSRGPIVLKHSSYRQIFQCPLSLVSDLHICWNTVGCSLRSSDQLGVSLALRGSGLCSHLSRHHLLTPSPCYNLENHCCTDL